MSGGALFQGGSGGVVVEVSVVTPVELTTMFEFLGAVCEDGIGSVVAEESADTLSELLRRFAICRCGIPGRQRLLLNSISSCRF